MTNRDKLGRFIVGADPGPGRKSEYDPSMNEQARKLALLGQTDKQIANFFDVSPRTFENWKANKTGFLQSLIAGRTVADANVADALYKRAVGLEVFEERLARKANGIQEAVQVRKQIPPDPGAAAMWLNIRQRGKWASKPEDRDPKPIGGADDTTATEENLRSMSDEDLATEIETLMKRLEIK